MIMMKHSGAQALLYVVLSLAIFMIWTTLAKTEFPLGPDGSEPSGASLVASIEGKAVAPFVKRRLLPDSAWVLRQLIPDSVWNTLDRSLQGSSRWQHEIRTYLGSVLRWRPEHYPLLVSGYFLIWLSILGFLYQAKDLTRTLYDVSETGAWFCGAMLGIALLGGNGSWADYPYDLPNAFVFLMALNALIKERWWFPLAFAAAAYSKETSVLLIGAFVLLRWERWRQPAVGLMLGLLILIFVLIRYAINLKYAAAVGWVYWYPVRNSKVLLKGMIQFMWVWWIVLAAIGRMFCMIGDLPRVLRRLVVPLLGVLLSLSFFYGWIDERRGYFEVLPIAGLVVLQWTVTELGLPDLLRPRDQRSRRHRMSSDGDLEPGEAEVIPVPRSPGEVTAMLARLYPDAYGLPRLRIFLRPWICPFEEVLSRIPEKSETLLDAGCGIGLASVLTAGAGLASRIVGFDTSSQVIAAVPSALVGSPLRRRLQLDALPVGQWPAGTFDVVLCIDILHHVPWDHQQEFCSRLCQSVRPGGTLLFKDLAPTPRWKAWANQLHDALMAWQWVSYRSPEEIEEWLRAEGLSVVESRPCHRLWYAHYLIKATKKSGRNEC